MWLQKYDVYSIPMDPYPMIAPHKGDNPFASPPLTRTLAWKKRIQSQYTCVLEQLNANSSKNILLGI